MRIDRTTVDAAMEMLRFELDKVAANIIDINTDAKKARLVTLTLKLSPNERIREDVVVELGVSSKLAPVHPFKHDARILMVEKGVFAMQSNRSVLELVRKCEEIGEALDLSKNSKEDEQ
ncbi:MAG: hypothetical protein LBH14_03645 [Desulfobulbaceae bacterium]|jgi:hypothetical protein|nr:hypothetical protein [Desulfobulbaceae bacterium]